MHFSLAPLLVALMSTVLSAPTERSLLDPATQISLLSQQGLLNLQNYALLHGQLLGSCNFLTAPKRLEWLV